MWLILLSKPIAQLMCGTPKGQGYSQQQHTHEANTAVKTVLSVFWEFSNDPMPY